MYTRHDSIAVQHKQIHIYIYIYVQCIYMYIYNHTHIYMFICTYRGTRDIEICVCTHIQVCIYRHADTHICIYINKYGQASCLPCVSQVERIALHVERSALHVEQPGSACNCMLEHIALQVKHVALHAECPAIVDTHTHTHTLDWRSFLAVAHTPTPRRILNNWNNWKTCVFANYSNYFQVFFIFFCELSNFPIFCNSPASYHHL